MAGELLLRLFDEAKYERLKPSLIELRRGRALSQAAQDAMRQALTAATATEDYEHAQLKRVVAASGLAPRAFLSPRELADALISFVTLGCYPRAGDYSLVDPGDNFVVVESAGRVLLGEIWYDHLLNGDAPDAYSLDIPSEVCDAIVPHGAVGAIRAQLASLMASPELAASLQDLKDEGHEPKWIVQELGELQQILQRASSSPGLGLAHRVLL